MTSPIELLVNWALDENIEIDVEHATKLLEDKTVEEAWALLSENDQLSVNESSEEDSNDFFIPQCDGDMDF